MGKQAETVPQFGGFRGQIHLGAGLWAIDGVRKKVSSPKVQAVAGKKFSVMVAPWCHMSSVFPVGPQWLPKTNTPLA